MTLEIKAELEGLLPELDALPLRSTKQQPELAVGTG
jgi:hypothetical protein